MRVNCYRCFRPEALCLCVHVTRIKNRTRIIVLQHPRERFHAFGTVRFVALSLENSTVHHLGNNIDRSLICDAETAPKTGLLYPSPTSVTLEDVAEDDRPERLVILDGTWSQAHSIYKSNPWVQELPHYHLRPTAESQYRIRKEPAMHCLSTVEATSRALHVLEPETPDLDRLLDGFNQMIEIQLDYLKNPVGQVR